MSYICICDKILLIKHALHSQATAVFCYVGDMQFPLEDSNQA